MFYDKKGLSHTKGSIQIFTDSIYRFFLIRFFFYFSIILIKKQTIEHFEYTRITLFIFWLIYGRSEQVLCGIGPFVIKLWEKHYVQFYDKRAYPT